MDSARLLYAGKKTFGVEINRTSTMVDVTQQPRILLTRDDIYGFGEKNQTGISSLKRMGRTKESVQMLVLSLYFRRGMPEAGLRISYFKYTLFVTKIPVLMKCMKRNVVSPSCILSLHYAYL
jgi:hypothetical protein